MFDKFKSTIQQAGDAIREQAENFGDAAREKTMQLIEDWLKIFPKLEAYGLTVSSFGICMALSPSLEVELQGDADDFSHERIKEILDANADDKAIQMVFKTIQTTLDWHRKIGAKHFDFLLIKLIVKITPEVKVYLGAPKIV